MTHHCASMTFDFHFITLGIIDSVGFGDPEL